MDFSRAVWRDQAFQITETLVLERWLAKGFRNTIGLNIISDIFIIEIKLQVLLTMRSCFVLKIKELKSKNCSPQDLRTNQLPNSRAV